MNATESFGGAASTPSTPRDVVVRVPTRESELRAIRRAVSSFVAGHGGDDEIVADFQLAASELATNVMQHSDADAVTVAMRLTDDVWQLDVHDADDVPDLAAVASPPSSSLSGRGLLVVQAVMDDVAVVDIDGHMLIRCSKRSA